VSVNGGLVSDLAQALTYAAEIDPKTLLCLAEKDFEATEETPDVGSTLENWLK
jgi:hypothetical protein